MLQSGKPFCSASASLCRAFELQRHRGSQRHPCQQSCCSTVVFGTRRVCVLVLDIAVQPLCTRVQVLFRPRAWPRGLKLRRCPSHCNVILGLGTRLMAESRDYDGSSGQNTPRGQTKKMLMPGIEPETFALSAQRSAKLSYTSRDEGIVSSDFSYECGEACCVPLLRRRRSSCIQPLDEGPSGTQRSRCAVGLATLC